MKKNILVATFIFVGLTTTFAHSADKPLSQDQIQSQVQSIEKNKTQLSGVLAQAQASRNKALVEKLTETITNLDQQINDLTKKNIRTISDLSTLSAITLKPIPLSFKDCVLKYNAEHLLKDPSNIAEIQSQQDSAVDSCYESSIRAEAVSDMPFPAPVEASTGATSKSSASHSSSSDANAAIEPCLDR
jgi:hypothetical protein